MYEFKFLVSYIIIWPFFTDPILVIIEYVPYGDLLGYLRRSRGLNDTYFKDPDVKPQTSLTSQQLMKFSWHVAEGMRYLSTKNVSFNFFRRNRHHEVFLDAACIMLNNLKQARSDLCPNDTNCNELWDLGNIKYAVSAYPDSCRRGCHTNPDIFETA